MPPNICRLMPANKLLAMKAAFAQKVGYTPSAGQALVHSSNKRFRVVVAGARFGKSMGGGFEGAFFLNFPDFRIWCVAPVYELADKEFNWTLEFLTRYKLPDGRSLFDLGKLSDPSKGSRTFSLPWGSFIKTKSTENADALLGEELDMIIFGEASCVPRAPWERKLRARIGPRDGMVLAFSTGAGDSGLFAEFVENGLSDDEETRKYWETWQFKTLDNPTFSKEEWEQAKAELDPDVFAEQYEGKLVSRRGYVFRFTDKHIITNLPKGYENWPVIVSIQPGYKNPCAVAFLMVDQKAREYIVFDEIYVKEMLAVDIVAQIRQRVAGKNFLGCISDFWQMDANTNIEKAGLGVRTNDEEKKLGRVQGTVMRVRAVQNVLRVRENGEPRLKVFHKCENTINDFKKCKWPDKPKEESEKLEAEIPLPKFFQAPQAVSHAISFLEVCAGSDVYAVAQR